MARTFGKHFLRNTIHAGDRYKLLETQGGGAVSTTIARYVAGGLTTSRRWRPYQASSVSEGVDAPPINPARGWHDDGPPSPAVGEPYTVDFFGNWEANVRYRRSGQPLEVNQQARIVVRLARVDSSGTYVGDSLAIYEISGLTFTTTVQSQLFDIPSAGHIGPWEFAAGEQIHIDLYTVTTVAGTPTAPAVATDLILVTDENSATASSWLDPKSYRVKFQRAVAETAAAAETLSRVFGGSRSIGENAAAADTLERTVLFPRSLADSAPADDTNLTRLFVGGRALGEDAPAADTDLTRAFTGARALAESAPATDDVQRQFIGARSVAEDAPAADTLTRLFVGARALAESAPADDTSLTRAFTGARALAESAPATDDLTRTALFPRALAEDAPASDDLTRRAIFNRALAETAEAADTDLVRAFVGGRTLSEDAPATDALNRQTTYARTLEENIGSSAEVPIPVVRGFAHGSGAGSGSANALVLVRASAVGQGVGVGDAFGSVISGVEAVFAFARGAGVGRGVAVAAVQVLASAQGIGAGLGEAFGGVPSVGGGGDCPEGALSGSGVGFGSIDTPIIVESVLLGRGSGIGSLGPRHIEQGDVLVAFPYTDVVAANSRTEAKVDDSLVAEVRIHDPYTEVEVHPT